MRVQIERISKHSPDADINAASTINDLNKIGSEIEDLNQRKEELLKNCPREDAQCNVEILKLTAETLEKVRERTKSITAGSAIGFGIGIACVGLIILL